MESERKPWVKWYRNERTGMWRHVTFARPARPACPHSAPGCYFYLWSLTGACTSSLLMWLSRAVRARSCSEECNRATTEANILLWEKLGEMMFWLYLLWDSLSRHTLWPPTSHWTEPPSQFPCFHHQHWVAYFHQSSIKRWMQQYPWTFFHNISSLFLCTPREHSDPGPYFTTRPLCLCTVSPYLTPHFWR